MAAIADASSEFGGSCGRCYEVKCRNSNFKDGYGKDMERSSACFDESKSIVVRTVDACPCNYPGNAYSNSRWCCGDGGSGQVHMDLSIWAFEKLASTSLGVIALDYREVPCNYVPENQATSDNPSPPEKPEWFNAKRPDELQYVKRFDDNGQRQGSVNRIEKSEKPWAETVDVTKIYKDGTHDGIENDSNDKDNNSSDDNGCTDNAPGEFTCEQQKNWGKCNENFIIANNFCRKTCGRC